MGILSSICAMLKGSRSGTPRCSPSFWLPALTCSWLSATRRRSWLIKQRRRFPLSQLASVFVGIELAASLAHPGGNVTGIDVEAVDYRPKWLDILKAVAPNVGTVAVLADANETPGVLKLKDAAPRLA